MESGAGNGGGAGGISPRTKRFLEFSLVVILFLVFGPVPYVLGPLTYMTVLPGVYFRSSVGGGSLSFDDTFTTTKIYWEDSLIKFDEFTIFEEWEVIGFQVPAAFNVTVNDVNNTNVAFTVGYSSDGTFKIFSGDKGRPESITGADYWAWVPASETVDILIEGAGAVVVYWGASYSENDTYSEPGWNPVDLITQYVDEADISGFVIATYTEKLGLMAFTVFLVIFTIPIYQKMGAIPTALAWVLFWGGWNLALPPSGVNVAIVIMIISISVLIITVLLSRRSRYAG